MSENVNSTFVRQHETRQTARTRRVPPASPARAGHYAGLHPEDRPDEDDEDVADDLTIVDDEDDEWYPRMPKSALRLRDTRDESRDPTSRSVTRRGTSAVVVTRHRVPARAGRQDRQTDALPRPRFRLHWLVVVGLALIIMTLGWVLLTMVASWWTTTQNTWTYGYPRTYQCDAVVGQNHDSAATPSHFIALNLNSKVEVIEFPAGDGSKAKIYLGPSLIGPDASLAPVTLSFADVNGDGKPDLLIHVQGGTFVFLNTGTAFRPATPADHVRIPNS